MSTRQRTAYESIARSAWTRHAPAPAGTIYGHDPSDAQLAYLLDEAHDSALRAVDDEHAEALTEQARRVKEAWDDMGRRACRAHGLRVRTDAEWTAEKARRQGVIERAARQDVLVAFAARMPAVVRSGGVEALRAKLDAVQSRCGQRTIDVWQAIQAVREALDEDGGSGSVTAEHHVAGRYGYRVSYTTVRAEAIDTPTPGAQILVRFDRVAGVGADSVLLSRRCAQAAVREMLARESGKLPRALASVTVTVADSVAAGNCAVWTERARVALGEQATAAAVYAWACTHKLGDFALRAISRAEARVAQQATA